MALSRRDFLKIVAISGSYYILDQDLAAFEKALAQGLKAGGQDVAGGFESRKGLPSRAIATTCLQCGVTDGLLAYVEEGKIVKLEGNPKHPNTRGKICAKGQAGLQQVYDPFRLKYPLRRRGKKGDLGAKWQRISWEEAVEEVAKRLSEILKAGEPGRFVFHRGRDRFKEFTKRFTNAFGTKHVLNHTSVCEASLKIGYEHSFGQDLDSADAANAKYMLHFGENIFEAAYMMNPLAQRIAEARVNNRAKLVVFDPRLSNTAGAADEWIPILPGTDGAVLLAMANVIMGAGLSDNKFLDEWTNSSTAEVAAYLKKFTPKWASKISGVPAETIKRIALEFAKNQPGYARAYNGISNHTNGAYNARALALLNAVVGNIDKKGGFCLIKSSAGFGKVEPEPPEPQGEFPLREDDEKNFPLAEHHTDHLLPERLKRLNYQIKLYILHQYNPLFINPDRKLWAEVLTNPKYVEFTVDFTPFMSETAALGADLIIPDVTYLERLQVNEMPSVNQIPFIQLFQPVVKPLYENHSMYETMLAIAKKVPQMASYFAFDSVEEYCKKLVEGKWGEGSWERLKKDGVLINRKGIKPGDPAYKSFDELAPQEFEAAQSFQTYKKVLSPEKLQEMRAKGYQFPPGDGPIKDEKGKKTVGVIKGGIAYQGFPTGSGIFQVKAEEFKKHGFNEWPTYQEVPQLKSLKDGELVLLTGKWNVHTQSRTSNCAWLQEIVNYNPAWVNKKTAKLKGIKEGDRIRVESKFGTKRMTCRAHLTEGIHPKCIFISTSLGHWAYGNLASKSRNPFKPEEEMWYLERKWPGDPLDKDPLGRTITGWSPNWIVPSDEAHTDPIGGEYAWSNVKVKVRKA